jgi:SAM-dependent methyltransferase
VTPVWADGDAYEPFVGRWSRRVAPRFVAWLGEADDWCDVGCGTGALAHAVLAGPARRVLGVDPSAAFLEVARRGADHRFTGAVGDAAAIPAGDGEFDRVVAALVLTFVPDPAAALAEMRRVARPGGVVAAYVWDYAEGMQLLRRFWDAAVALDPAAAPLDEGRRPGSLARPRPLAELFTGAGLQDVAVEPIVVDTVFRDADDLWLPFLGGQGPAPGYVVGLSAPHRAALRDRLLADLPVAADGSIPLTARVWAVRGRR